MRSLVVPGWGQFSQARRVAGWTFLLVGIAAALILAFRNTLGVPALLAWLDVALVAAAAAWDATRTTPMRADAR